MLVIKKRFLFVWQTLEAHAKQSDAVNNSDVVLCAASLSSTQSSPVRCLSWRTAAAATRTSPWPGITASAAPDRPPKTSSSLHLLCCTITTFLPAYHRTTYWGSVFLTLKWPPASRLLYKIPSWRLSVRLAAVNGRELFHCVWFIALLSLWCSCWRRVLVLLFSVWFSADIIFW